MTHDMDTGKANTLLLKNARLIDGLGSFRHELRSIHLQDGEITEIGRDIDQLHAEYEGKDNIVGV